MEFKGAFSYSLFGGGRRYAVGVIGNIIGVRKFFPGWDVVIHIEKGHYLTEELRKRNVVLVQHETEPGLRGTLWRFETITWSDRYTHVCCRDLDGRIGDMDRAAVEDWVRRDTTLHYMLTGRRRGVRPVFAGMFGMKTSCAEIFTREFKDWDANGRYGDDEDFLNFRILPLFKDDATVHQKKPPLEPGSIPWPSYNAKSCGVGQVNRGPRLHRTRIPTLRIGSDSCLLGGEEKVEPIPHPSLEVRRAMMHIQAASEALTRNAFPCLILEENSKWRADAHDLPKIDAPWLWVGLSIIQHGREFNQRRAPKGVIVNGVIESVHCSCTHGIVYLNAEGARRMIECATEAINEGIPIELGIVEVCEKNGWTRPALANPWVYDSGARAGRTNIVAKGEILE